MPDSPPQPRWITAAEVSGEIGIPGTIADQQIAFGDGTSISGSPDFTWNDTILNVGDGGLQAGVSFGNRKALTLDSSGIYLGDVAGTENVNVANGTITLSIETGGKTAAIFADEFDIAGVPLHLGGMSAPSTPREGTIYFNSSDKHFYGWNGTAWKQLDN